MNTLKWNSLAAMLVALFTFATVSSSVARAEVVASQAEVSLLGGAQALNKNDTAFQDRFVDIPAAAAFTYHLDRNWAVQGEFSWLIPVKQSVNLGTAGSQDRKTPDILAYQANVVAKLPVAGSPWTPYLTGGAGAMTFLSTTDPDRVPQLSKAQTAFAVNFGAGTTYGLGTHWAVRGDLREFAAFPSKNAAGLSSSNKADTIWTERGTLGLAYRF